MLDKKYQTAFLSFLNKAKLRVQMIDDPNNEIKYLTIGKIDKACNKGIIPHMMEHDEPIMIEREDTIYNERFKNVDEYVK